MGDLSSHFDLSEFRDRHSAEVPTVDPQLIEHLERLRAIIRRPIIIVSGWRSPATNKRIGGASNSLHLVGKAADIRVGTAHLSAAIAAGFTGIGTHGDWVVHLDVRQASSLVIFTE